MRDSSYITMIDDEGKVIMVQLGQCQLAQPMGTEC